MSMANLCSFTVKIVGKKENVEEFIEELAQS
jgi:hypothetical protein